MHQVEKQPEQYEQSEKNGEHDDDVRHLSLWRLTIELSGLPGLDCRAWLHHIRGGQARPAVTGGRSNEWLGHSTRSKAMGERGRNNQLLTTRS